MSSGRRRAEAALWRAAQSEAWMFPTLSTHPAFNLAVPFVYPNCTLRQPLPAIYSQNFSRGKSLRFDQQANHKSLGESGLLQLKVQNSTFKIGEKPSKYERFMRPTFLTFDLRQCPR
jgi:hypothetical protein